MRPVLQTTHVPGELDGEQVALTPKALAFFEEALLATWAMRSTQLPEENFTQS